MTKNATKALIYSLLTVLPFVFLVSCAHPPDMTGMWHEPGAKSSIEFRQDGTFTAVDDMGMTVNGNYTFQEKGKIQFKIKHPDSSVETITGTLVVQDHELILTSDKDKEVLRYKKSK